MVKLKSYKESYDAGRFSVISEIAKTEKRTWEEFQKSGTYSDLIKNLEKCGIKHPYNENTIWWAFNAGFKANISSIKINTQQPLKP